MLKSKRETILWRFFPQSIKRFPEGLRSIKLVSQAVEQDVWLVCDNECENVSLIDCAGFFDLSEIKRLKRLVYQPQEISNNLMIKFPDLNGVEELVLVYNGNIRYFQPLLMMCHNVTKLTLYSHKSPNSGIRPEDLVASNLTIPERELQYCSQDDISKDIRKSFQEDSHFSEKLLNETMNILIKPIFTSRSENTLKHLLLHGFKPSIQNMNAMRDFVVLSVLAIDYEYIDDELFEHLPRNLRTLVALKGRSTSFACRKLCCSTKRDNAIGFRKHRSLKTFAVETEFFTNTGNFFNLPETLECLKVTYTDAPPKVEIPSLSKLRLKRLVIIESDEPEKDPFFIEDRSMCTVRYMRLICFLSRFIDLRSVDKLVVEKGEETVVLCTKNF